MLSSIFFIILMIISLFYVCKKKNETTLALILSILILLLFHKTILINENFQVEVQDSSVDEENSEIISQNELLKEKLNIKENQDKQTNELKLLDEKLNLLIGNAQDELSDKKKTDYKKITLVKSCPPELTQSDIIKTQINELNKESDFNSDTNKGIANSLSLFN